MKPRYFVLAGLVATSSIAILVACATNEEALLLGPDADSAVSMQDAEPDGPNEDGEAGVCDDCEYFPETCADEVLCPNGPFGTSDGIDSRTQVSVITGRSANDVWVAGALGGLAHFDGTSWTRSDIGVRESIRGLWLRESAEVSIVELERLYSRGLEVADAGDASAGGWTFGPASTFPLEYNQWERTLTAAWAAPDAGWLWGVTKNTCNSNCMFSTGGRKTSALWRLRRSPSGTFEIRDAIGSPLCQAISCGALTSIHGSSANDLWAVGSNGAAIRVADGDGDTPTVKLFNSQTMNALYGVWAASASDAWAVGAKGVVRHYTGHDFLWDIVSDVPTTQDLRAVWGSSPSDIWVVGGAATVFHYDGHAWSRVKIAGLGRRRPTLTTVWGPSPGNVWIGGQGIVLSLGGKP